MNINAMFPSRFIKCADLEGKPRLLTIDNISTEKLDEDDGTVFKPALHFSNSNAKPLILNRTNANTLETNLGPETDNWRGRQIVLEPKKTQFMGKEVDCIRVRMPRNQTIQPVPPKPEVDNGEVDDVPW